MNMDLFMPISKVDASEHLIYLIGASETKDAQDQIMDYEQSKSEFIEWSTNFAKATMGKSYGNVRLQHRPDSPIGKVSQPLRFDDENKRVEFCVKIVDENAWKLVEEGVLTGASIGGKYKKKWYDSKSRCTRYIPKLNELSLVDKPCNPDATYILIKCDGTHEIHKFNSLIKQKDETMIDLNLLKASLEAELTKSEIGSNELRERLKGALSHAIKVPLTINSKEVYFYVKEVYPTKVIIEGDLHNDKDCDLYQASYEISEQGEVKITSDLQQVRVEYVPTVDETPEESAIIQTSMQKADDTKDLDVDKKDDIDKPEAGKKEDIDKKDDKDDKLGDDKKPDASKADNAKKSEDVKDDKKPEGDEKVNKKSEDLDKCKKVDEFSDNKPEKCCKEDGESMAEVSKSSDQDEVKKDDMEMADADAQASDVKKSEDKVVDKSDSKDKNLKEVDAKSDAPPEDVKKCDDVLEKSGAKHSKDTLNALQKLHHSIIEMAGDAAACRCEKCSKIYNSHEDVIKADGPEDSDGSLNLDDVLQKVDGLEQAINDLTERNNKLEETNAQLLKKVDDLESRPDDNNAPTNFAIDKTIVGHKTQDDVQKSDSYIPADPKMSAQYNLAQAYKQVLANPVTKNDRVLG